MIGGYSMTNVHELTSEQDWQGIKAKADADKPVFVFKHSTSCPISADAFKQFNSFVESEKGQEVATAYVKVIESRPVSNKIAEDLEVVHKSPQIFLLKNGEVKWTESHWNITQESIENALQS